MTLYLFTKRIFEYFRNKLLVVLILLITGTVLEGVSIVLLVPILELALGQNGEGSEIAAFLDGIFAKIGVELTLETGLMIFFAIFLLQSGFYFLRESKIAKNIAFIRLWLRNRLYKAIFHAEWSFFFNKKRGSLSSAILIDCEKAGNAVYSYMLLWTSVFMCGIYMSTAFLISWKFTISLATVALVVFLMLKKKMARGGDIGKVTSEMNGEFQSLLNEHFDSVKLIKGCGLEHVSAQHMNKIAEKLASLERNALTYNAKLKSSSEPVFVGLLCLGIYFSVAVLKMGMAEIMVILFIFLRLFPKVIQANQLYFQTLVYVPSFERVDRLTMETALMKEPYVGSGIPFEDIENQISFRDVVYSYEKGHPVLNNVSLNIKKGTTVALVGGSGAGKTTISDMVLGLLHPDSGEILVDGKKLTEYDLHAWRKKIGYVTQEAILLHDTVRNNILWGANDNLTDLDIGRAVSLANADEFIDQLPQKLDTVIGDRGFRMSGGQRQRLSLARTLARKPELLILDEATSALDSESELRVQMAIDGLSRSMTILIIAHRLSTIKNADLIYVLEKGVIIEQGTYDELCNAGGRFSELYNMQSSEEYSQIYSSNAL